ncbi:MAG: pyridoxamine 5'-phosphate oxidase family protein [Haloechinothrix sp.]
MFGDSAAVGSDAEVDPTGLEALSRAECLALLATAPVGRIVYTERALPAVRPVKFVLHDDVVVIHASAGGPLADAANNAVVAFEADHFSDVPHRGWSVTLLGRAKEVTDPERVSEFCTLGLEPWTPAIRGHFVVISIEAISGWRIPSSDRSVQAYTESR